MAIVINEKREESSYRSHHVFHEYTLNFEYWIHLDDLAAMVSWAEKTLEAPHVQVFRTRSWPSRAKRRWIKVIERASANACNRLTSHNAVNMRIIRLPARSLDGWVDSPSFPVQRLRVLFVAVLRLPPIALRLICDRDFVIF